MLHMQIGIYLVKLLELHLKATLDNCLVSKAVSTLAASIELGLRLTLVFLSKWQSVLRSKDMVLLINIRN